MGLKQSLSLPDGKENYPGQPGRYLANMASLGHNPN
jgi:hypothetical protein